MRTYLLQFVSLSSGSWLALNDLSLETACELLAGFKHSIGLNNVELYALDGSANGAVSSNKVVVSERQIDGDDLIFFDDKAMFSCSTGLLPF